MKFLEWIKQLLKNNKKKMISEEQLISYQQNFSGQKFQWIKTDRPELIGKVVTVRDIQVQGNQVMAIFDNKSQCNIKDINNRLMMLQGDTQPLSKAEVESIHKPRVVSEGIPSVKLPNGERSTAVPPKTADTPTPAPVSPVTPTTPVVNPFAMFNSDITDLTLKLKIKMPDKKLLKMMYNNAEDKEVFLDELAKYVDSMINNKVVYDSMKLILDPKSTKKSTKAPVGDITLTEVEENK